ASKHFRIEMQTGRRSRDGTERARENCLVTLAIARFDSTLYVRRQRRLAMRLKKVRGVRGQLQFEQIVTSLDETRLRASRQLHRTVRPKRFAHPHLGKNSPLAQNPLQKYFDLTAARLRTAHARRNDARVVKDK